MADIRISELPPTDSESGPIEAPVIQDSPDGNGLDNYRAEIYSVETIDRLDNEINQRVDDVNRDLALETEARMQGDITLLGLLDTEEQARIDADIALGERIDDLQDEVGDLDEQNVKLTGAQTITGAKTFANDMYLNAPARLIGNNQNGDNFNLLSHAMSDDNMMFMTIGPRTEDQTPDAQQIYAQINTGFSFFDSITLMPEQGIVGIKQDSTDRQDVVRMIKTGGTADAPTVDVGSTAYNTVLMGFDNPRVKREGDASGVTYEIWHEANLDPATAPDLDALTQRVTQNESDISDLEDTKADQVDLDATNARVTQNENDIADLEANKADQVDLDATNERVTQNESDIADLQTGKEDSIPYGPAGYVAVVNEDGNGFSFETPPDFSFIRIRGVISEYQDADPDVIAVVTGDGLNVFLYRDTAPISGPLTPNGFAYRANEDFDVVITDGGPVVEVRIGDFLFWADDSSQWVHMDTQIDTGVVAINNLAGLIDFEAGNGLEIVVNQVNNTITFLIDDTVATEEDIADLQDQITQLDNEVVKLTGNQTISGVKTFNGQHVLNAELLLNAGEAQNITYPEGNQRITFGTGGNLNIFTADDDPTLRQQFTFSNTGHFTVPNDLIANSARISNQVTIGNAPNQDDHATRKDYVDTLDEQNVKITGAQNVGGAKTFNANVACSVDEPVNDNHLTRKDYVDTLDGANVKLTGAQTVGGVKTFSSSPAVGTRRVSNVFDNTNDVLDDCDTALHTGSYYVDSGATGAPIGGIGYLSVVQGNNDNNIGQIFFERAGQGRLFWRDRAAGTWSEWKEPAGDVDINVDWDEIENKPDEFPPEAHTHNQYALASDLQDHADDQTNPHEVTAAQVNAPTIGQHNAHVNAVDNPHQVTADQVGAAPEAHDHTMSHVTDLAPATIVRTTGEQTVSGNKTFTGATTLGTTNVTGQLNSQVIIATGEIISRGDDGQTGALRVRKGTNTDGTDLNSLIFQSSDTTSEGVIGSSTARMYFRNAAEFPAGENELALNSSGTMTYGTNFNVTPAGSVNATNLTAANTVSGLHATFQGQTLADADETNDPMITLGRGSDNLVNGQRLLYFNTDRGWTFRQRGTAASAMLALTCESNAKNFEIWGSVIGDVNPDDNFDGRQVLASFASNDANTGGGTVTFSVPTVVNGEFTVNGARITCAGVTTTGQYACNYTGATSMVLNRTGQPAAANNNINYRTTLTGGGTADLFAGQTANNAFAVGTAADLSNSTNRYLYLTEINAQFNGDVIAFLGQSTNNEKLDAFTGEEGVTAYRVVEKLIDIIEDLEARIVELENR
ncbi:pyocin knob domain-containing protein [Vibrio astriarenae]|uniref:pyocin knob domain-containing protein n=1 Tax=Vibrio astriarenae TaxID=1481923 RepID=UPI003735C059